MPESRYVSASRLMVMVRYLAVAVVVLVIATLLLDVLSAPRGLRRWLVVVWLIGFPLGGWVVWRRAGS